MLLTARGAYPALGPLYHSTDRGRRVAWRVLHAPGRLSRVGGNIFSRDALHLVAGMRFVRNAAKIEQCSMEHGADSGNQIAQDDAVELAESPHSRRVNAMVLKGDTVWSCGDDYLIVVWNANVRTLVVRFLCWLSITSLTL